MQNETPVIFFDFGDTLVRLKRSSMYKTAYCIRKQQERMALSQSLAVLDQSIRKEWDLRRTPEAIKAIKSVKDDILELEYWIEFYTAVLRRIGQFSMDQVETLARIQADPQSFDVFPEVRVNLSSFKRKGCELGIISNAFPSARRILERLNLQSYFKYVVFSNETGTAKPEARIYKAALNLAKVSPDKAWFVDDRIEFLESPLIIGMKTVLIVRNGSETGIWQGKKVSDLQDLNSLIYGKSGCYSNGHLSRAVTASIC